MKNSLFKNSSDSRDRGVKGQNDKVRVVRIFQKKRPPGQEFEPSNVSLKGLIDASLLFLISADIFQDFRDY